MVTLDLVGREEGVYPFTLTPSPETAGLSPEQFEDVRVTGTMDYRTRRVFVSFEVEALACLECDRTLRPFKQHVSGSYALLFVVDDAAGLGAKSDENVRPFAAGDRELDITDAVRDTLLLALPMRRVAPDAEDLDFPTEYGKDKDEEGDPRWAALRKLQDPEKN